MTTNKHGLSRYIPADVIRAVRQACGNGCVLCGRMPYQYDHFDPEWAEATDHSADGIALLCGDCHGEKTAGRLDPDEVRRARATPYNSSRDARWDAHLGRSDGWALVVCGDRYDGPHVGISINGEKVFELRRDNDGDWLISGAFCDEDGRESLRIEENEVTVKRGAWDVRLEGTILTVQSAPSRTVAAMELDAKRRFVAVRRLRMQLANGCKLDGDARHFLVTGPSLHLEFGGNEFTDRGSGPFPPMVRIGGPRLEGDLSLALNDPALGKWEDWIAPGEEVIAAHEPSAADDHPGST